MAAGMATREIKTRRVELFPFAHKISVWRILPIFQFQIYPHFKCDLWLGYDIIHCEFYIIISHNFLLKENKVLIPSLYNTIDIEEM